MTKIRSAFTKEFNLSVPVVGCPMAGVAGAELAAAVARAGGLGFLGSGEWKVAGVNTSLLWRRKHLSWCPATGTMSAEKIQSEYRAAVEAAGSHKSNGVIGIGLLNFCITDEMMAATVACKPHSVWLAVGDFKPFIKPLRQAGANSATECIQHMTQPQSVGDCKPVHHG